MLFRSIEHAIQPKQFKVLPDIFTTCPDLKDIPDGNLFKMFTDEGFFEQGFHEIDKTGDQDGSSGSKENDFDVNEKIINPSKLEFIPKDEWKSTYFSLEDLKRTYFAKRNGPARHFNYKLANALKITREFPNSYNYIGVVQIERCLIKVNSMIFGSLLGIHAVQGGLFHKQGDRKSVV